jgi:hypothetical protein
MRQDLWQTIYRRSLSFLNLIPMKIRVGSDEFKAWHEVGHATVCLHYGGDLDGIELMQGSGVTRGCDLWPDKKRDLACGGFAIQYHLMRTERIAGVDPNNADAVSLYSAHVFDFAWKDQQDFIGRAITEDNQFTKEENEAFMWYAIERVAPIFAHYLPAMQELVRELCKTRKVDGRRVKELLLGPR